LQALSIRTGVVHVHGTPSLPSAETKVYLDIEGLPSRDFYYLIGATVEVGETVSHYHFWADDDAEQDMALIRLTELLDSLPNHRLFHFGNYEIIALKNMQNSLPPQYQEALGRTIANAVNVLTIVHKHVYFPTYSNGLKDIARSLGHQWTDPDASGLQSVVWRET
jgi:predicted RecB family nuclease